MADNISERGINQAAASAIEGSWVKQANKEAAKLGAEIGKQEGLTARIDNIQERINKIAPSSGIAERSMRFLKRQARNQEFRAGILEWKKRWAEGKGENLANKAEQQVATIDRLQSNVGRRVKEDEQLRNVKQDFAKDGLDFNVNKGIKGWFDRVVVARVDSIRISWNEKLAKWNSSRAEGQLQNARGYTAAADSLREAAKGMREIYAAAIGEALGASSSKQMTEMQSKQRGLSNDLSDSSEAARVAAQKLDYARTDMSSMAGFSGLTAEDSKKPLGVVKEFVEKAGSGLDNAGNTI